MLQPRRVLLAVLATLLTVSGCGSLGGPTFPPIVLPSFVPITLPSGFTLPSFAIPNGSTPCTLITADEAREILGQPVADHSSSGTNCGFFPSSGLPISVLLNDFLDIDQIKQLNSAGQDLTVNGTRAYYVNIGTGDQLYVEKNGKTLIITALGQSGMQNQLTSIANLAVTRF